MHELDPEFEVALRELGIDPATIRPGTPQFEATTDDVADTISGRSRRAARAVRSKIALRTEGVHQPYIRWRAVHEWRRHAAESAEVSVSVDPWDYGTRAHSLEIRTGPLGTQKTLVASGDLVLVRPSSPGYRRATRAWSKGRIAPSRSAWYVWLVPGQAWSAELVADAVDRWRRVFAAPGW